ncbi:MAG: hypothetical protein JXB15_05690 [Anaerolineales bacterium]|nr:hypothetical protein [Anaerolineales bacterium]
MKSQNRVIQIGGWLAFLWLVAIVASYYLTHKPFLPEFALSLAEAIWRILVVAILLISAGGVGRRICVLDSSSPAVRLSLQAGLGLGIFSLGTLLLGLIGGLNLVVISLIWLALAGLFRREWIAWIKDWRALPGNWRQGGGLERFIAACVVLIMGMTLVKALSPPIKFDALVYHLPLAHQYISAGRIAYIAENMYWGMPQTAEMLYSLAVMLAGDPAALLLGWSFGLLTLVGLLGFVSERLGLRAAWGSIAALLCGFTLADALSWGYVDWLTMLFGFGFMVMLDGWRREGGIFRMILAASFAGFALGTKYTAGVLLLSGLLAVFKYGANRGGWRSGLKTAGQFGVAAALVSAPWWVKNAFATGNPFYPFFFPSGAMDAYRLQLYQASGQGGSWPDLLLLPIRATFLGAEMAPGYSASLGPLLLGLSILAWLGWRNQDEDQRALVLFLGWLFAPVMIIWILAGQLAGFLLQSRLYFAAFPVLAVLAGAGFANLNRFKSGGVRFGRLAAFLVGFVLILNLVEISLSTVRQGAFQVLFGLRTGEAYLADNLGWYTPAMQAVRNLPGGSRVMMLWEARSLDCLPVCEPDEILDRWLWERNGQGEDSLQSVDEIRQSWLDLGYTHVLYHRLGADFLRQNSNKYQPEDWQALDELLAGLPVVEPFSDAYTLYLLEK